jgi:hypothetical protein
LALSLALVGASSAAAQDDPPLGALVAAALEAARRSAVSERVFDAQHYQTRTEWLEVDGGGVRRAAESLVRVRVFAVKGSFEVEVDTWRPGSYRPQRFACKLDGRGLVFWGEVEDAWRQLPGASQRVCPPSFLPRELVEWVVPLLWDQGLPAELLYTESADVAQRPQARALIRITPPRPGGDRATLLVADAATERSFDVAVGGPEDGRLLQMKAVDLYASRERGGLRQEESRQPLSAREFAERRRAWRKAFLATRVELRVQDGRRGQPVPGVTASLYGPDGATSDASTTGPDGVAHLRHAGAGGSYRLTLKRADYHTFSCLGQSSRLSREVTLHDGRRGSESEPLRLELDMAQLRAGLDVDLWPGVLVRGRVLSPQGKAVARAAIRFDQRDEESGGGELRHLVWTDRQGGFRLEASLGALSLVIDHPRWQAVVQELRVTPTPEPLEIVLVAGAEIQGRVLDAEGRPLAGALVEALVPGAAGEPPGLFDPTWSGRRVRDTTDELGRYLLRGVRPGGIVLRASRLGYKPLQLEALAVGLAAPLHRRLLLDPGGGVGGRFVDDQGRPLLVDGSLTYRPAGAAWSVSVALADQATFLVEEPTIGSYELELDLDGYRRVRLGPVSSGTLDLVVAPARDD